MEWTKLRLAKPRKYFIALRIDDELTRFREVPGKTVWGINGFDFFVHRPIMFGVNRLSKKGWAVSDGISGHLSAYVTDELTEADAIRIVRNNVRRIGVRKTREHIMEMVRQHGLSPRWQFPAPEGGGR